MVYVVVSNVPVALFGLTPGVGTWQLVSLTTTLLTLAGLALWRGMMYVAYQGRWYELPIADDVANDMIADGGAATVERNRPGSGRTPATGRQCTTRSGAGGFFDVARSCGQCSASCGFGSVP